MNNPTPKQLDEVLNRIVAAPPPVTHITYDSYRDRLYEKIPESDWKRSQSGRAKMRRLLGGK